MNKTIVLKTLEQKKIPYTYYEYDNTLTEGIKIAEILNENVDHVYKTLVTTDNANHYYVFVIPVDKTLDLKKCAKILNIKKLDMLKQKDLEPLTGYVHGGCSPIGMKKKFPTYYNDTIKLIDTIYVSGGRVGLQINIKTNDLIKITDGKIDNLISE